MTSIIMFFQVSALSGHGWVIFESALQSSHSAFTDFLYLHFDKTTPPPPKKKKKNPPTMIPLTCYNLQDTV